MSVHRSQPYTVVECITVAAIIATLIALLIPAFSVMRAFGQTEGTPPKAATIWTVQHDGHWWIGRSEHFVHHPDCPCRLGRAELSE